MCIRDSNNTSHLTHFSSPSSIMFSPRNKAPLLPKPIHQGYHQSSMGYSYDDGNGNWIEFNNQLLASSSLPPPPQGFSPGRRQSWIRFESPGPSMLSMLNVDAKNSPLPISSTDKDTTQSNKSFQLSPLLITDDKEQQRSTEEQDDARTALKKNLFSTNI